MPKLNQEFPVTLSFRVSIPQGDYVEEVAAMHGVKVADYLRALLDAALAAEAKASIGMPGADDPAALARAKAILQEVTNA
ncbi:hypothetical protein CFH99_16630 [Nocardioides aromaticivorans]|uniref:Toxin-antitoxin system HicB family antitoxin n=1 Tax=Nocardioides aromaticivorans TaxID=200618 RepID=A0ABX7PNM9_9ACTN|nr:hypothetical protein [Nocardioides aromaticivorans]QSR27248.1 hypothetical protein CFH99_16630 [Nocardioides aromaticivorans]